MIYIEIDSQRGFMRHNSNLTNISQLKVGDYASIAKYDMTDPAYRMKLLALGLTRNTSFRIVKTAPLGDPVEIELRGYRLSLRKHEANSILVKKAS